MLNHQLTGYIRKQLQRGAGKKDIKKILIAHGWKEEIVQEAMDFVLKTHHGAFIVRHGFEEDWREIKFLETRFIRKKLPAGVKIISAVCHIGSFIFLFSGFLFILGGFVFFLSPIEMAAEKTSAIGSLLGVLGGGIFLVIGVISIIIAAIAYLIGRGLWKKQIWARIIIISGAFAFSAASIISIVKNKDFSVSAPILFINLAVGAYLLLDKKVKAVHWEKSELKFNKQSSTAVLIVSAALILLLSGAAASYWYFTKQIEKITPSISTGQNSPSSAAGPESKIFDPKEKYFEFREKWDGAKNLEELNNAIMEYGSKNRLAEMEKLNGQFESMPEPVKKNLFASVKSKIPALREIADIQVKISGDKATLKITTANPEKTGEAAMIVEDSEWKLDSENWTE